MLLGLLLMLMLLLVLVLLLRLILGRFGKEDGWSLLGLEEGDSGG